MGEKVETTNLHTLVEQAWRSIEGNGQRFSHSELSSIEKVFKMATEDDRLNAATFLKSNGVAPSEMKLARGLWEYYREFDAKYAIAGKTPERTVIPKDAYKDSSRPLSERLILYEVAARELATSRSVLNRFRYTNERLSREKPELGGTLLIQYDIAPDGNVAAARVVPKHQAGTYTFVSNYGDVETSLEMTATAKKIRFEPPPEGEPVSIVVRYTFASLETNPASLEERGYRVRDPYATPTGYREDPYGRTVRTVKKK